MLWWTMGVAVGVAVVTMVLPGVAVVTPWCCCGDHGVAVVTMVLLW